MADLFPAFVSAIKMHRPAVVTNTLYGGYSAEVLTDEAFSGPVVAVITDNIANGGRIIPMDNDATVCIAQEFYKALGYEKGREFKPPKFLQPKAKIEEVEVRKKPSHKKRLTKIKRRPKL